MFVRTVRLVLIIVLLLALLAVLVARIYVYNNMHYDDNRLKRTRRAGYRERQIRTPDGALICYAEGPAKGKPLLLIHGQGMCWEDYDAVLPSLAKSYHVFAVDCFGHGGSEHHPSLYTCQKNGEALIWFIKHVIGKPCLLSGHSSGGVMAAWIASSAPEAVAGLLLEDPPLFRVTPKEMQKEDGCFAWKDSFEVIHSFLNQGEEKDYVLYYIKNSLLFSFYGGMRDKVIYWAEQYRKTHPAGPLKLKYLPYSHLAALYYYDRYDLKFGDAFYTGRWMRGIRQEQMLKSLRCPVIYLKANVRYGKDGTLYAANSLKDADRVQRVIPNCETVRVKSGHSIHTEKPKKFLEALGQLKEKV